MKLKSIKSTDIKGKTILYRSPYDIEPESVDGSYKILDNSRIKATLDTVNYLLKNNCKVVVLTWVGRPNGQKDDILSTKYLAEELGQLINHPVKHVEKTIGPETEQIINSMQPKDIIMLENTRFYPEEENDDDNFAKQLTYGCDLIVFDGFPQSHRIHASTTGILRHLPAVAGFYFEKEVSSLSQLLEDPKRPFSLVIGGKKALDKVDAIKSLYDKADTIIVGGAAANAFLKASGTNIRNSYVEDENTIEAAKEILNMGNKLITPTDFTITDNIKNPSISQIEAADNIPNGHAIADIGPKTSQIYADIISKSNTVFWAGPMGIFEDERFSNGTRSIISAMETATKNGSITIAAGGDTIEAIDKFSNQDNFSHISLAGGATLAFLSGKNLPVLDYLEKTER